MSKAIHVHSRSKWLSVLPTSLALSKAFSINLHWERLTAADEYSGAEKVRPTELTCHPKPSQARGWTWTSPKQFNLHVNRFSWFPLKWCWLPCWCLDGCSSISSQLLHCKPCSTLETGDDYTICPIDSPCSGAPLATASYLALGYSAKATYFFNLI